MIKSNFEIEFQRIKNLNFIKSNRSHNTGIGKTFEDHLGIIENNLKNPDFEEIEIKSQRFLSESKITLFTKSPTFPPKANQLIKDKFGELDENLNVKIIHTSFYGDRFNSYRNKFGFKIKVNKRSKKIHLIVKDLNSNKIVEQNVYYTFEDIIASTTKLKNLCVVTANTDIIDSIEHFHFTKATLFLNFNINKFIELIKRGKIQYDIRIGAYRSGKNIGKPHDHGSGFRIHRDNIKDLYDEVIEID